MAAAPAQAATQQPAYVDQPASPFQRLPSSAPASVLASSILAEPQGYPKLATFMGKYSDVAIFRRFQSLNMVNLMRLQAGLLDLEAQYRRACSEDDTDTNNPVAQQYSRIFAVLHDSKDNESHAQLDLLDKIREQLKDYSTGFAGSEWVFSIDLVVDTALLQASQVSKLETPDEADLQRLREWLDREQGNFLQGHERETWAPVNDYDQATLAARSDGLSRSTATGFMRLYDWLWGRRSERTIIADSTTGQRFYPDSNVKFVAKVFTSVLASLIPGIIVLALNFIDSTTKRIGAMLAFTSFFAFVLSYWTLAETIDIFAATAAFAAVEVVFIGSAITNGTTS
ncbi:hypothetical protein MMC11_006754 [Xylographa trunciseda]|nr:hypothetical protein [Xylographa trunciseda]